MFGLGTWEILLILIAALVFIGPSKLPSLARTMGKGMRDVRRAMAGFEDEVRQASSVPDEPPAVAAPQAEIDDARVPRTDETTANAAPSEKEAAPDEPLDGDNELTSEADSHHV